MKKAHERGECVSATSLAPAVRLGTKSRPQGREESPCLPISPEIRPEARYLIRDVWSSMTLVDTRGQTPG